MPVAGHSLVAFRGFVLRSDMLFVKMSRSGRVAKRRVRSSKFRNRRAIRQASLVVVVQVLEDFVTRRYGRNAR
jgi:hypothetical protein